MSKIIQLQDNGENAYPVTQFGDLLWTNPNPTNKFAGGVISLNLSAYKYIGVLFNRSLNSDAYPKYEIFKIGTSGCAITLTGFIIISRFIDAITNNGVSFGTAYETAAWGQGVDTDERMIPIEIYGIR